MPHIGVAVQLFMKMLLYLCNVDSLGRNTRSAASSTSFLSWLPQDRGILSAACRFPRNNAIDNDFVNCLMLTYMYSDL